MAPTVLFVPGAWHTAAHFAPICDLLHARGYETSCSLLPSCGGGATCTMQDDTSAVKAELERLLAHGADVVLVAHSYGGVVATEAALAVYGKVPRAEKGLAGGVVHILYLCALVLQPGQTSSALRAEGAPNVAKLIIDVRTSTTSCAVLHTEHQSDQHVTSTCRIDNPEALLFNDLPVDEQSRWASELRPMPLRPLGASLTYPGYLHHPSTYLFCTNDQSLVLELQKLAVSLAVEAGAQMNTVTCDAGEWRSRILLCTHG
jgi:pimeloyl-ACP methyl ester carboxylesterase